MGARKEKAQQPIPPHHMLHGRRATHTREKITRSLASLPLLPRYRRERAPASARRRAAPLHVCAASAPAGSTGARTMKTKPSPT